MRHSSLSALLLSACLFVTPVHAGPLQLKLRQTRTDGATRKADTNFELDGMFGFSVFLDTSSDRYYLWGSTNAHRKAWKSSGTDMWDIVYPTWSTLTQNPCDARLPPHKDLDTAISRDKNCGDAAGVWFKPASASDTHWEYYTSPGAPTSTRTIDKRAAPGYLDPFGPALAWPWQWSTEVYDAGKVGFPDLHELPIDAGSLNRWIEFPRPLSPMNDIAPCRRQWTGTGWDTSSNPGRVSSTNNPMAVKRGNTWHIATNAERTTYTAKYAWTAGEIFRIVWARSDDDGKTLADADELFSSVDEGSAPMDSYGNCGSTGLLLRQLFIDGDFYYLLAQKLAEPSVILFRTPLTADPSKPDSWFLLTNADDPAGGSKKKWVRVPETGIIDVNAFGDGDPVQALRLFETTPPGIGSAEEKADGAILRVANAAGAGSPSGYIGVITRREAGKRIMELWSTTDLSRPFTYESDIVTEFIPERAVYGYALRPTGYGDLRTVTGNELDLWLDGTIDHDPAVARGGMRTTVAYRARGTLSGGIFSPRAGLRTSAGNFVRAFRGLQPGRDAVKLDANAVTIRGDETITIVDRNGGTLDHGDLVNLQVFTGQYVAAVNGGGSVIEFRDNADAWETFRIIKTDGSSGAITDRATIAFRTVDEAHYLGAPSGGANGCGGCDSNVVATSTAVAAWETFTYVATPVVSKSDLGGDGYGDVVWRNPATGSNAVWMLKGAAISDSAVLPYAEPALQLVAHADFNGDRKTDILWRNSSTGANALWLMDGSIVLQGSHLPGVETTWSVAGTGDLDGDGRDDVVWSSTGGQNAVWFMNGGAVNGLYLPSSSGGWKIAAIGNYDGDRFSDIAWRNDSTGEVALWLMNGATIASSGPLPTQSLDWKLLHAGDLDGDSRDDLLWRNTVTGQNAVWFMNGLTLRGEYLPSLETSWRNEGTADFNADGRDDIFWRNPTTTATAVWLMDGTSVTGHYVRDVESSWEVAGRR